MSRPIAPLSLDPKVNRRRENQRLYWEKNKEKLREYHRQYYKDHRKEMNEAVNRWHRRKKFEVFGLERGERTADTAQGTDEATDSV